MPISPPPDVRPRPLMDLTNHALLDGLAAGDERALVELMARYSRLVRRVTHEWNLDPASRDDICQTVWARLWEHRCRIREPEHLGTWLATVTRHETWRLVRSLDRERASADVSDHLTVVDDEADVHLLAAERCHEVRGALDRIDPRARALLLALSADARPDYRRISAELGRPIGSIGPTRQRALEKLRRAMANPPRAAVEQAVA